MKWVLLALYIITILAIIFLERKKPNELVLWVTIVVCIPYVGIILYLIFGSTLAIKLTTYFRKKRLKEYYPNYKKSNDSNKIDNFKIKDTDKEVMKFNNIYNDSKISCYDDIKVYDNGMDHYKQLFEDIKNAKECIYVEFYTIHNDEVGHAFVEALTKKAEEGIKVLIMCDFIANINVPPKMFRPLRKKGGVVRRLKPFLTHYRSHRKIVVIDHEISYIGGMNIGKKYINRSKKKNPWRDTQVRLVGKDCSSILDQYFLTDFLCAIKRSKWKETIEYINSIPKVETNLNDNLCQFIVGGVDNTKESVKMCYLSMIRSAKNYIRIQTPYFIPDSSILDALKTAAASGVRIEMMLPGIKSSFFLDPVTTYYVGELLDFGVKVYKYNGYIHAKTMIIDDEVCCIGSVNMDIRSLTVDDEVCGVFYNNDMVRGYNDLYNNDITSCKEYSLEEFINRGKKEKFLEDFFLLFSALM